MKKKGFTLAEVLITIAIIGVVAAITLPTLMQDGSKQQLGTKLAKFHANLEQITRAAAIDEELGGGALINILNEEMLFDGSGLSTGANATPSTLRDGTKVQIATSTVGTSSADTTKYGNAAAQLTFYPEISGLTGGPTSFNYVVTTRGFVFPDNSDSCLKDIYNNKYRAAKKYGPKSTNCKTGTT